MQRLHVIGLGVALATGCGSRTPGSGTDAEPGDRHDARAYDAAPSDSNDLDAGGLDGGGNGLDGGGLDGGGNGLDAGGNGLDAGGNGLDAGGNGLDAGGLDAGGLDAGGNGTQQLTQYTQRSCWSWGGFGSVRPDAPAHIVAWLQDLDGIADIATHAEVVILGDAGMRYSLGLRPIESLGDTGCCQRAAKVAITYNDFLAAGAVIHTSTMWSAEAIFHDLSGHSTTARCDDQWRLNSTPIGS